LHVLLQLTLKLNSHVKLKQRSNIKIKPSKKGFISLKTLKNDIIKLGI